MKCVLAALFIIFSGYDRSDWISRSSWTRARTAILKRDRTENYWICRYSGIRIANKSKVDIDHIIPLKYAYGHCGDTLPDIKKRQLATDTLNLVAVSFHENRSKGDDGVLEYMPSDNQCWYLSRWKAVSKKYHLCLPKQDSAYIDRGVRACKLYQTN